MIRQRVFSSVSSTPCAHLIFLISIKVAKKKHRQLDRVLSVSRLKVNERALTKRSEIRSFVSILKIREGRKKERKNEELLLNELTGDLQERLEQVRVRLFLEHACDRVLR